MKSVFHTELFLKIVLIGLQQMQSVFDPFMAKLSIGALREIGLEAVLMQPLANLLATPLGERECVSAQRKRRRFISWFDHTQRVVAKAKVTLEASIRRSSTPAAFKMARSFIRLAEWGIIALDKMISVFVSVVHANEIRLVYVD